MKLDAKLEAVLFASARPMTVRQLAQACGEEHEEIKRALEALKQRLETAEGGTMLVSQGQEFELVSRPEAADVVRTVLKEEAEGELTKPSLEALAILSYRGPLTRPELEQIRGVQSSLILRNLMLRGLVEMREDTRLGQPLYAVTLDFLKALGVSSVKGLPDFERLHAERAVEQVLQELVKAPESSTEPPTASVGI